MITFTNHMPNFCDGVDPETKDYENLEALLQDKKDWLEDRELNLVFAQNKGYRLMIAATNKSYFWVLGYVNGIDLRDYLPNYQSVYKLSGDHVKILRALPTNHFYLKDGELLIVEDGEIGSYSVRSLSDLSYTCAWVSDDIDVEFVRYATQEEIDKVNAYKDAIR